MSKLKFFAIAFGIIGSILLSISLILYYSKYQFVKSCEKTKGEVVELKERRSSGLGKHRRSRSVFYPVIKFETKEGETIVFQATVGSNPPSYEINEEVDVKYQKNLPQNAVIDSFGELWFGSIICGVLSFVFFGFSIFIFKINSKIK